MTTLPIPVDEVTAAAYESASVEERERSARVAAAVIRASLVTEKTPGERFALLADRLGAEAQANGWNDELDEALLRGDFDHDD